MSLSAEDREWVGSIVKVAVSETLNASRDFTRSLVEGHSHDCPNVQKVKWLALGVGLGLGSSVPAIVQGIVHML
jgi:hypothetical protein